MSARPTRRAGWRTIAVTATTALAVGSAGAAASGAQPPGPLGADQLNAVAEAQIGMAQQIKESLTPAERKLGSSLVVALRRDADPALRRALPGFRAGLTRSSAGVLVDIQGRVTDALVTRLRSVRATVVHASPTVGEVRAYVPAGSIRTVAGWAEVTRVLPADPAISGTTPARRPPATAPAVAVGSALRAALASGSQGSVVSEGDKAHGADLARRNQRVSGVGVKVCALSDGVDSLSTSQASGDLPAVDVLPGQEGQGDEGTAMLEIIHDLAPNAQLGFASAFNGAGAFADNIRALQSAGCTIIVDDVLYPRESPFQDSPIAQAVIDVTRKGVVYFSSAGNAGNVRSGTSGNYEGMFADSGRGVGKMKGTAHDFDPGTRKQIFEPVSYDDFSGAPAILHWADPLGRATDDYDLYLLDADGNIVGMSQDVQDGTQDPIEGLMVGGSDLRLAVVKYRGAAKYFQLSTMRGRYRDSGSLKAFVRPGMLRGHTSVPAAFSIAAAPADEPFFGGQPGDPDSPSGPYPGVFRASQKPEIFTSDGPRRVFFAPDGSPAPAVRKKPDFTAADGVSTSLSDYSPFYGTSAAAPHAAAIAALVLSGNPGKGAAFVRNAFKATALDLAPAGWDERTGSGILRADLILRRTGATPQPYVTTGSATVVTTSDGDAYLEPGETGTVSVAVTNSGDGPATSVALALRGADAGVTVTPARRSLGALAPGATKRATFTVGLPASWVNGTVAHLGATVTFAGRLSPTTSVVEVPTGKRTPPRTFAYAGPAVPIPDGDPAGLTVPITVSGVGSVAEVRFSVDGTACSSEEGSTTVGVDHTWVGDLSGTLTSPSGRTVRLWDGGGSSGNNLCQVVFTDTAMRPFSSAAYAEAPFTGSWVPSQPLSAFAGEPTPNGTWTFTIADDGSGDTGTLRAVSLHIVGIEAP